VYHVWLLVCEKTLECAESADIDILVVFNSNITWTSYYSVLNYTDSAHSVVVCQIDKLCVYIQSNMSFCALLPAPVTQPGLTPLGFAVSKGKLDVVKFLVRECKANVNGERVYSYIYYL